MPFRIFSLTRGHIRKRLNCWPPQRGPSALFLKQRQCLQTLIFLFLLLDVLPDRFFIAADSRNVIPTRTELLASEIFTFPREVSGYRYRALALDEAHHLRHGVFRWYLYQHMHRVKAHMPFQDITLALMGQRAKYITQIPANAFITSACVYTSVSTQGDTCIPTQNAIAYFRRSTSKPSILTEL